MPHILFVLTEAAEAGTLKEWLLDSGDGSFTFEWISTCQDGIARLSGPSAEPVAAIIMDMLLADSRGINTYETLHNAAPHVPILILCREQDEPIARHAVHLGAQDYLVRTRLDAYTLPKLLSCMIQRSAFTQTQIAENERARVTLNSIGDAVISTDVAGNVTYLNSVAEQLTGWSRAEASGRPAREILQIVDGCTREPAPDPLAMAIIQRKAVSLGANTVLVHRHGHESEVEDTAAPIHDQRGDIAGAVIVFHDVSTVRAMSLRMSHLAQHDFLTDLPNRLLLQDRLTRALASAHRNGKSLALLYIDVDNFKRVNDTLGHSIGDKVLQSIASRLVACVRRSDTVSRQGGDEFVVLLTEVAHEADVHHAIDKILAALGTVHHVAEHTLNVVVSIGVSAYPGNGTDAESLLREADSAMLRAKARKRNLNIRSPAGEQPGTVVKAPMSTATNMSPFW